MVEDCIFCKIVAGEIPAQIIDAGRADAVVHGHRARDPRPCAGDPEAACRRTSWRSSPTSSLRSPSAAQRLALRVHDRLGADGVNLINSCGRAAWQTVFHFHIHVIPRYAGDPLKLPWVPTPGDMDEIAAAAAELR